MPPLRIVAVCALLASASAAAPGSSPPAQPPSIEIIGWLTGCWALESPARSIEEHWMPPRAGSMLNLGRTTRNGKLVEYEFVLVTERNGTLVYQAHPSGQPSAEFVADSASDSLVVFANPTHDFPQQVGYQRVGQDSLTAWIQGTTGGAVRKISFPYQRVACAAGS